MNKTHYTPAEFTTIATRHVNHVRGLLTDLEKLTSRQQERILGAERDLKEARRQLATMYLPVFSQPALADATRRTRLDPRVLNEVWDNFGREREALERRIAALDADDRVAHPNRYIHPEAGEYTRRLRETLSFFETWQNAAGPFESDAKFMRLITARYGTDQYVYQWWHPHFYRCWREGDEITEDRGKASFQEVLAEYHHAAGERDRWKSELEAATARVREVEGMLKEREDKAARLSSLEETYLNEARGVFLTHIDALAPEILIQLAGDAQLEAQLTRVSGLKAKLDYLEGILQHRYGEDGDALRARLAKVGRKIDKMRRPKMAGARIPAAEVEPLLNPPGDKLRPRWHRVEETSTHIYGFNRYDRGSLVGDFLWWDVMTDGRLDGDFIPQVREFHTSHPDYHYQPEGDEDDRDAAVAAVLGDQDDSPGAWGDAS